MLCYAMLCYIILYYIIACLLCYIIYSRQGPQTTARRLHVSDARPGASSSSSSSSTTTTNITRTTTTTTISTTTNTNNNNNHDDKTTNNHKPGASGPPPLGQLRAAGQGRAPAIGPGSGRNGRAGAASPRGAQRQSFDIDDII